MKGRKTGDAAEKAPGKKLTNTKRHVLRGQEKKKDARMLRPCFKKQRSLKRQSQREARRGGKGLNGRSPKADKEEGVFAIGDNASGADAIKK